MPAKLINKAKLQPFLRSMNAYIVICCCCQPAVHVLADTCQPALAATLQQPRHAQQEQLVQQAYSPLRTATSNSSPRHSPSNSYGGGLESIPAAGTSSGDESGSPQAASVAFISLAGSAMDSPRSPSRLRITSLNSHSGLQVQQKQSFPGLPNFITVEKVQPEVAEVSQTCLSSTSACQPLQKLGS
jgi:hypothetical protein